MVNYQYNFSCLMRCKHECTLNCMCGVFYPNN